MDIVTKAKLIIALYYAGLVALNVAIIFFTVSDWRSKDRWWRK